MRQVKEGLRFLIVGTLIAAGTSAFGQFHPAGRDARMGPMLDQGLTTYQTPELTLRVVNSSGTVAALEPKGGNGFDFTPSELLAARSVDGYYHLGDLDLRLRAQGTQEWLGYRRRQVGFALYTEELRNARRRNRLSGHSAYL